MKKLTMKKETNLTFEEGCEEYLLYCKARNLRDGTIKHYKESMKSIYRFIVPNIIPPISSFNQETMDNFILDMKETLQVKDTTIFTYARALKTLMRIFMKNAYMKKFDIALCVRIILFSSLFLFLHIFVISVKIVTCLSIYEFMEFLFLGLFLF